MKLWPCVRQLPRHESDRRESDVWFVLWRFFQCHLGAPSEGRPGTVACPEGAQRGKQGCTAEPGVVAHSPTIEYDVGTHLADAVEQFKHGADDIDREWINKRTNAPGSRKSFDSGEVCDLQKLEIRLQEDNSSQPAFEHGT